MPNKALMAEQQLRCWELRVSGYTYREISAELGIPLATVSRRLAAYRKTRVEPQIEEHIAAEADALLRYKKALDAQIQAGRSVARNVEVAVKVSDSLRKLLGIDAPTQVEAVVHQVDQTDIALAELVREAQAAAAVAEQNLREGTA